METTWLNSGIVTMSPCELIERIGDVLSELVLTRVVNHNLFYKLCLSLASGVDLAIANKEVPSRSSDISLLLKQLYKYKKDSSFEAAFVVLMISIKSACNAGWFSNKDADELELLTKEAMKGFSNPEDVDIGPSRALPYLSNVVSRCSPQMKMKKILVSLGVKAGFGAYVSDFNISRDMITSQHEKICLFVAQMENLNTSRMVAQPQINLMLNGRRVQKEINFYTGIGPQLVTNVTAMLEDGVNLLQAVGQFNGSYVIALATTSITPSSETSEVHDSNQQLTASATSGIKKYKTSWQISLKCPISRRRIITPVKGKLCKHLECFDRAPYLEINLKEPLWRCPICKLPAGRMDLLVDQRFLKVLRESPAHVNDVILSKEGSWNLVPVREDGLEKNLRSNILHTASPALGKVPVLSTGLTTTRENIKPNNAPTNIEPTPIPLQQHFMNQPTAVLSSQPTAVPSSQPLPRQGSDCPSPWISNQHSTRENVKPNNCSSNIRPTAIPLQHHSTSQPIAVQSVQPLPCKGSGGTKPWLLQQHSTSACPKLLRTTIMPTKDDRIGRMRGSLTGKAYDAALSRLTSPPIQPAQAPPRPTLLPPHQLQTTLPTSVILPDRG